MMLRQYSLVQLSPERKKWLKENQDNNSQLLLEEKTFLFLGEIPNMKDHCAVIGVNSGKTLTGYHIDNFIELKTEEV